MQDNVKPTHPDHSFEQFIIQCCKAKETELRQFIKRILKKFDFTIIEDDYQSSRGKAYSNVHNLLAYRGNPRIALVAHTDVCRDHLDNFGPTNSDPVLKLMEYDNGSETKLIIQDRFCRTQVGGDDRLGVAINLWLAINSGYDMALLFTTDEEIGAISARKVNFPQVQEYDLLVQVDRGNNSDQIVNDIYGVQLCSEEMARSLVNISKQIGMPRYIVSGMLTDVYVIKERGMCKESVNLTCGYHNSISAQKDEYIDVAEARDTLRYVSEIVKHFYLSETQSDKQILDMVI